jgi:hypothetical protein
VAQRAPRWIHRTGVIFSATFTLESVVPSVRAAFGGAGAGGGGLDAVVRVSRFGDWGIGYRVLALAVKVQDEHGTEQDLLLGSSNPAVLRRNVFRPFDGPLAEAYFTSVMRFDVAGERLLFGARIESSAGPLRFDDLEAAPAGTLTIRLEVARLLGAWYSLGCVTVHDRIHTDERFRPTNTWPRVGAGRLGRWRDSAYVASQEGRKPPWPLGPILRGPR